MVVIKNSEYRNNFVPKFHMQMYTENLGYRMNRRSAEFQHNKDVFTWDPEVWEKQPETNSLPDEPRPGVKPSAKYKHALYNREYQERALSQCLQEHCNLDDPQSTYNNYQKVVEPKTPPPSLENEEDDVASYQLDKSVQAPTPRSSQTKASKRPKKPTVSKKTSTTSLRPKSSHSGPGTATAVSLKPPFVMYGSRDRDSQLGSKKTHNVKAYDNVHPSAVKALKFRQDQKTKRQKSATVAAHRRPASCDMTRQRPVSFDKAMDKATSCWQTEYGGHFVPYTSTEYERNAVSRMSVKRYAEDRCRRRAWVDADEVLDELRDVSPARYRESSPERDRKHEKASYSSMVKDQTNSKWATLGDIPAERALEFDVELGDWSARKPAKSHAALNINCTQDVPVESGANKFEAPNSPEQQERTGARSMESPTRIDQSAVLHALEESKRELDCVTRNDIVELKSLSAPPQLVKTVLEGVCILFGVKPEKSSGTMPSDEKLDYWPAAKKLISHPAFLNQLKQFDKDNIAQERIAQLVPYMYDKDFHPEQAAQRSAACVGMVRWVRAIYKYHTQVKAKLHALHLTPAQLDEAVHVYATNDRAKRIAPSNKHIESSTPRVQAYTFELKDQVSEVIEHITDTLPKDIVELRSMNRPPSQVVLVCEALCILMGIKPKIVVSTSGERLNDYWEPTKQLMSDANFLASLKQFDKDHVPEERITRLRPYISSNELNPECLRQVSVACVSLCLWVRAIYNYHMLVKPKLVPAQAHRSRSEGLKVERSYPDDAVHIYAQNSRAREISPARKSPQRKRSASREPTKRPLLPAGGDSVLSEEVLAKDIDRIMKSLQCLKKQDITELKSLNNPPHIVKLVLEALCILMGEKPIASSASKPGEVTFDYWPVAKKMMGGASFLNSLIHFDKDNIPEERITKLQPYIYDKDFNLDSLAQKSRACVSLFRWIRAVYSYHILVKPQLSTRHSAQLRRNGNGGVADALNYPNEAVHIYAESARSQSPPQKPNRRSRRSPEKVPPSRLTDSYNQRNLASQFSLGDYEEINSATRKHAVSALAALEDALESLQTVNTNDITELKSMGKPPQLVKLVMEAVCVLLAIKPKRIQCKPQRGESKWDYWPAAVTLLGQPKFIERLRKYDMDNIPQECITKLRPYINNPEFAAERVNAVSKACVSLCQWVCAMYNYHILVKPNRVALWLAKSDLQETHKIWDHAKGKLQGVDAHIAKLKKKFEDCMEKKKALESKCAECEYRTEAVRGFSPSVV